MSGESKYERELIELLEDSGAVLVDAKHLKYRLPDGRSFVTGGTPSDRRASLNALRNVRRVLGITRRPAKGIRREKRHKRSHNAALTATTPTTALPSLRSELVKALKY